MEEQHGNVLVSVLMGIYNCEDTLAESIDSILSQTHENWELILCDDCSRDGTYALAMQYAKKDSRIVLLKNEKNLTLGPTLNRCLAVAKGKYCARMDGDDVSVPQRFEKQVDFLESNPEFDVVGTYMQAYGAGNEEKIRKLKLRPQIEQLAKSNPCCHATIMMRTEVYRELGGYSSDPQLTRIEDVDLFWRFYLSGHKAANIPEPLYIVRESTGTFKRRKYKYSVYVSKYLFKSCKKAHLGAKNYVYALKPLLVGLLPHKLTLLLHAIVDKAKN